MIHRARVGRFRLFAIEDGWYHVDPLATFPRSDAAAWAAHGVAAGEPLKVSFGCFLVTDGERIVMVDSGEGGWASDELAEADSVAGRMPKALAALGVAPGAVEMVVHTHLHVDHFGGDRRPDGEAFFPEARLVVHRGDVDHFRADPSWAGDKARTVFFPFLDEGRVQLIEGPAQPAPGLRVVPTPGHTPGHVSVIVEDRGESVLVTGDSTHHPIQAAHPDWSSAGDVDPDESAATRQRLFAQAAKGGILLAGGHYPRPGVGRIQAEGDAYRFVSVELPITPAA